MKKTLLILFIISSYVGFSQISVSDNPNRKIKELNKELLTKFKKTETIFVLPENIKKEAYENVLKKHWKTTPYKIINYKDFNFENYLNNQFSFAYVNTYVKTIDKPRAINVYIYANFDVFMLDNEEVRTQLNERKKKDRNYILEKNKLPLASISLYPKNEYLRILTNARNNEEELTKLTYTKDVFYDFNIGFFQNGIQKINNHLKTEKPYNLYESDFSPELKNLTKNTLYIPEYLGIQFNGMRETHRGKAKERIKHLFEVYDFDFAILKTDELSNKITTNEITYYAKYTRVNTQRFLHIINAKTGNIIYRKHMPGMAYNLHPKHIFNLNTTIRKVNEETQ